MNDCSFDLRCCTKVSLGVLCCPIIFQVELVGMIWCCTGCDIVSNIFDRCWPKEGENGKLILNGSVPDRSTKYSGKQITATTTGIQDRMPTTLRSQTAPHSNTDWHNTIAVKEVINSSTGQKMTIDLPNALWLEVQANDGDTESQYSVGIAYLEGKIGLSGQEDLQKAVKFLKLAADKGFAAAQFCLASIYMGVCVIKTKISKENLKIFVTKENKIVGLSLLRKAAHQGYKAAVIIIEERRKNNADLLTKANGGDVISQFAIALAYLEGEFGESDQENLQQAVKFLKLAADKELAVAQYFLGLIYMGACPGDTNILKECIKKTYNTPESYFNGLGLVRKAASQEYQPAISVIQYVDKTNPVKDISK